MNLTVGNKGQMSDVLIKDKDNRRIGRIFSKDDADEIVKRVNDYDEIKSKLGDWSEAYNNLRLKYVDQQSLNREYAEMLEKCKIEATFEYNYLLTEKIEEVLERGRKVIEE